MTPTDDLDDISPEKLERAREIMRVVTPQMKLATRPFLAGIYGMNTDGAIDLVGTGTIIKLFGHPYLLTAEHVLRKALERFDGVGFHAGTNGFTPIPFKHPMQCRGYPTDVALVRLDPQDVSVPGAALLDVRRFAKTTVGAENSLFFVHGLPDTRSKDSALLRASMSSTLPYLAGAGKCERHWFKPHLHLAVDYSPKGMEYEVGGEATFEAPPGLSGSLLWRVEWTEPGTGWTAAAADVVGLITTWDEKGHCLVGTRIDVITPYLLDRARHERAFFHWATRGGGNGGDLHDWDRAVREMPGLTS